MAENDSRRETLEHILRVNELMNEISTRIVKRGLLHDRSKIEDEDEKELFDKYANTIKDQTYLEEGYNKVLLSEAIQYHYKKNRHHPEHFKKYICKKCRTEFKKIKPVTCDVCSCTEFETESDISQMNIIDLVEMIADWKAASERQKNGNIFESIRKNQQRFGISDQLLSLINNTIIDIFEIKDE